MGALIASWVIDAMPEKAQLGAEHTVAMALRNLWEMGEKGVKYRRVNEG